jgi:hypothetical protein
MVSIINSSRRRTRFWVMLEWPGNAREVAGALPGNGACLFDIDKRFPDLPGNVTMVLRVRSEQPTRKNVVNCHPDGSVGADHFPNAV